MTQHRQEKVAREMQRAISTVIRDDLRDPGLGLITVTRVEVSRDYRQAKIFVSILGSKKSRKKSLLALERARGFVQHHLRSRLTLRQIPDLRFVFDESIEGAIRISKLIDRAVGTPETAEAEAAAPGTAAASDSVGDSAAPGPADPAEAPAAGEVEDDDTAPANDVEDAEEDDEEEEEAEDDAEDDDEEEEEEDADERE